MTGPVPVTFRAASAPSASKAAQHTIRIEIQALRALAVALVLVYHFWPTQLTGGFIGVDVFFVVSGFLITGQLFREVSDRHAVSLSLFWARRARRLMPAALLVLAVVLLATVLWVPDASWRQWAREIGASALYVENWQLARDAVDYLGAEYAPSPVQHYWSLSVEEQFYIAWPLLLIAAIGLARVARRRITRAWIGAALSSVTLVSLAVCVLLTRWEPSTAYFSTLSRAWEFGAGGLLAVATVPTLRGRGQLGLLWAGVAAIVVAAATFSDRTAFPGVAAALPVAGTVAVIAAGAPGQSTLSGRLLRLRSVRWLGDVSYGVYLWHWPLIVLAPVLLRRELTVWTKTALLVLTLLLAWATKVAVEDPLRTRPRFARARPCTVLAATAVGIAVVVGGSIATTYTLERRIAQERALLVASQEGSCFGSAALVPSNRCSDPFAGVNVAASSLAKSDRAVGPDPAGGFECETPPDSDELRTCTYGAADATRTIAMLGDSHALQWLGAMRDIVERRGWRVVTYFKSACSGTGDPAVMRPPRPNDQRPCADWGAAALDAILADPSVDTVVTSNASGIYTEGDDVTPIGPGPYQRVWSRLTAAGVDVLVIADTPRSAGGKDVPDCLAAAGPDPSLCDGVRTEVSAGDAMASAASASTDDKVHLLDLNDWFCVEETCHTVIGGVIAYSDSAHVSNTYARTLSAQLELALPPGR
ncbi:MAG: acyltransferase [Cellulomonadaceae bacterium]|nr:acyltransferase [Cellulomonadaceae bacterium]